MNTINGQDFLQRGGELPINILKHSVSLIGTNILPHVPPKHKELFKFGIQAFSLTPFSSLNSNARQIIENNNTALSKVYRLVSNPKILQDFSKLVNISNLVSRYSLVNIDFSTFCGFETLAFGIQTGEGRAIPIWANCITYPITEVGSQNKFVLSEIKSFGTILGFYPRFVFDRGFWIPDMIKFFLKKEVTFYLRIKQSKLLEFSKDSENHIKHDIKSAARIGRLTKDAAVTLYGCKLRLIISPPPSKQVSPKKSHHAQRWYILTNDLKNSREKILDIYKHRFEIEETFKDLKHISKLKKFFIKKKLSFRILLNFVCLSFWVAYWCRKLIQLTLIRINSKKKRSYFKIWWENLQRQIKKPLLKSILESGQEKLV